MFSSPSPVALPPKPCLEVGEELQMGRAQLHIPKCRPQVAQNPAQSLSWLQKAPGGSSGCSEKAPERRKRRRRQGW